MGFVAREGPSGPLERGPRRVEGTAYDPPDSFEFELEAAVTGAGVREGDGRAVFADAEGFDAVPEQNRFHPAGSPAVLLEFDDDRSGQGGLRTETHILELQVQIDGDTFGLMGVDQRDAGESRVQFRAELLHREHRTVLQIGGRFGIAPEVREVRHRNLHPFFLRTAVVGLPLDFQESYPGVGQVASCADFLPDQFAVAVVGVGFQIRRVEIDRVVGNQLLPIHIQSPIALLRRIPQQPQQRREIGQVLAVDAVHQRDGLHLIQGDGVDTRQQGGQGRVLRHFFFAGFSWESSRTVYS